MFKSFQKLYAYRELLIAFTVRNIQVKYKQTIFGFLWAVFLPVMIVLSGLVVKISISILSQHDPKAQEFLSVSVKALPWAFFIGALRLSVASLVSNMHILKKVYFPRVIFPLGYTFTQLYDFVVATIIFSVIFLFMKIPVNIHMLWLPVIFIFLILFTTGLGIVLSAANLFFRDVKHIVDVMLMFAIFFTPVFFEADSFGHWGIWLKLNPVGAMLECINQVVVHQQPPDFVWMVYAALWGIFTFVLGWVIFHKCEPAFAENI